MADEQDCLTATAMAQAVREKTVSPVELVDRAIARIERRNPSLNAMVVFGFDEARERARAAEHAVMAGETLGMLHGVPTAMKDCFDFKPGWVTTFGGVRALRNWTARTYCTFAERMEAAGAIILGKTNSPVFGFRGTCDNYLFGPTRNPFDVTRNSGGSSGGSAAMVADGMLALAEGTDGGGSIRIPASWCGVYGYKASFGRVPMVVRPNAFGGTAPFLFEGPITRTVGDAALALSALSGYDSRDPYSIEAPLDAAGAVGRSIAGWKIAYTRDFGIFPVDPEVARVTEQALAALQAAGAIIEEAEFAIPHSQQELSDLWCRFIAQGNLATVGRFREEGIDLLGEHADDLPPELRHWCGIAAGMSAQDTLRDQAMRSTVYDAFRTVLDRYRLIVSPTLACLAVANAGDGNTLGPRQISGEAIDPLIGWCMTYLVNFTGHPAASVPAGLSAGGLPVGLQIVGRRYADEDVLAASAAIERQRPWLDSYRVCAARSLAPALDSAA